jgi:hypothetical protein
VTAAIFQPTSDAAPQLGNGQPQAGPSHIDPSETQEEPTAPETAVQGPSNGLPGGLGGADEREKATMETPTPPLDDSQPGDPCRTPRAFNKHA